MAPFRAFLYYLPFAALVFLGIYLYRLDPGLIDVRVSDWRYVALATVLMLIAFFVRAWMWYRLLLKGGVSTTFRLALASQFRPVLAKYVPGKVWTVLATANAVSDTGTSFRGSFFLATWFQACLIAAALLIGATGIVLLGSPLRGTEVPPVASVAVVALVAIVLAPRTVSRWLLTILQNRGYVPTDVQAPPGGETLVVGIFQWALIGLAFAWLFRGLGVEAGVTPVFLQPLANTLGMISVVTPGGLAVREATMVAYLGLGGIDPRAALLVAVAARLWFVVVELIVFAIGLAAQRGLRLP